MSPVNASTVDGIGVFFDGNVCCTRSADGTSMQLHGRSISADTVRGNTADAGSQVDFIWQDVALPTLPARLSEVQLRELGSPLASPRRFELRSPQTQIEFTARAVQLHRAVGRAMFAVIPPEPVPGWLHAAWWLLLSVLRIPGVGKLLLSSRSAA